MFPALLLLVKPNLDRAVTLESPGESVRAICRRLSDFSEYPIVVTGDVARNTVVLRATGQRLETVLDRLADSLSATWQSADGKILIFRSAQEAKGLSAAEKEARMRALAAAIDATPKPTDMTAAQTDLLRDQLQAFVQSLDKYQDDYTALQAATKIRPGMPGERALARLLHNLPLDKLADIGPNDRQVFSTRPNRMQLPLPKGEDVLATFNRERENLRKGMDLESVGKGTSPVRDPRYGQFESPSQAERILLSVQRRVLTGTCSITAYFVDKAGGIISRSGTSLPLTERRATPDLRSVTLQIPDEITNLANAIMGLYGNVWPLPDKARNVLLNPATRDPLAWTCGEHLLAYGRAADVPLVAVLPDDALRPLMRPTNWPNKPSYPAAELAARIAREWPVEMETKDGWLQVRPRAPIASEAAYHDRTLLQSLLHAMDSTGHMTIEAAGEYGNAATNTHAGAFLEPFLVSATSPNGRSSPDDELVRSQFNSFPAAKFYVALPLTDRARPSALLRVGGLPGTAKSALSNWFYHSFVLGDMPRPPDPRYPWGRIERFEPTERFPSGIPDELRLSIENHPERLLMTRHDPQSPSFEMQPLADSGYLLDWKDFPGLVDTVDGRTVRMRFQEPSGAEIVQTLTECPPARSRTWKKLTELSSEDLAVLRRSQADQTNKAGGASRPPPP